MLIGICLLFESCSIKVLFSALRLAAWLSSWHSLIRVLFLLIICLVLIPVYLGIGCWSGPEYISHFLSRASYCIREQTENTPYTLYHWWCYWELNPELHVFSSIDTASSLLREDLVLLKTGSKNQWITFPPYFVAEQSPHTRMHLLSLFSLWSLDLILNGAIKGSKQLMKMKILHYLPIIVLCPLITIKICFEISYKTLSAF